MSLVLCVRFSYLVFVCSVAAVSSRNCFDVFSLARVYWPLSSGLTLATTAFRRLREQTLHLFLIIFISLIIILLILLLLPVHEHVVTEAISQSSLPIIVT